MKNDKFDDETPSYGDIKNDKKSWAIKLNDLLEKPLYKNKFMVKIELEYRNNTMINNSDKDGIFSDELKSDKILSKSSGQSLNRAEYLKSYFNQDEVKMMNVFISNKQSHIKEHFKKVDTTKIFNTGTKEEVDFEYKYMYKDKNGKEEIAYKKGSMIEGMKEVRKMINNDYDEM